MVVWLVWLVAGSPSIVIAGCCFVTTAVVGWFVWLFGCVLVAVVIVVVAVVAADAALIAVVDGDDDDAAVFVVLFLLMSKLALL